MINTYSLIFIGFLLLIGIPTVYDMIKNWQEKRIWRDK